MPELLQEVVMLDDGSTREYITNGTIDRYIERWNGKVKVKLQSGPTQIYRKVPAERYKFVEKGPVKRYNFFSRERPL